MSRSAASSRGRDCRPRPAASASSTPSLADLLAVGARVVEPREGGVAGKGLEVVGLLGEAADQLLAPGGLAVGEAGPAQRQRDSHERFVVAVDELERHVAAQAQVLGEEDLAQAS